MAVTSWTSEGMIWEDPNFSALLDSEYSNWRKYLVAIQNALYERFVLGSWGNDPATFSLFRVRDFNGNPYYWFNTPPPTSINRLDSFAKSNVFEWLCGAISILKKVYPPFNELETLNCFLDSDTVPQYPPSFDGFGFPEIYWTNSKLKTALGFSKIITEELQFTPTSPPYQPNPESLYLWTMAEILQQIYKIINKLKKGCRPGIGTTWNYYNNEFARSGSDVNYSVALSNFLASSFSSSSESILIRLQSVNYPPIVGDYVLTEHYGNFTRTLTGLLASTIRPDNNYLYICSKKAGYYVNPITFQYFSTADYPNENELQLKQSWGLVTAMNYNTGPWNMPPYPPAPSAYQGYSCGLYDLFIHDFTGANGFKYKNW